MAKQERMRFFDPPVRSMKQALGDIRGDKGDIVEPIKERSRKMARSTAKRAMRRRR